MLHRDPMPILVSIEDWELLPTMADADNTHVPLAAYPFTNHTSGAIASSKSKGRAGSSLGL